MTNEKTEQEQQELIYKFSMYERQIREMQQQIEAIEKGIVDLNSLNLGLNELIGSNGKEIYAQLGKGIFVNAKINSEDLNVDIGDGNFIKKSIPETKELIGEQTKKLELIKKELEQSLQNIEEELTGMMKELEN
jgi:prefoldin alpha subunit